MRDEDWGTYAPTLSHLVMDREPGSFRVAYDASRQARDGTRLEFSAVIVGRSDGSLRFEAAARPKGDFRTNRCGFSYFTELNRKRPPVDLLDFITRATNPIVHAADDRSVMQALKTLPCITRSARAFIGADKPCRIGPSTIAMRQNPYGSRTFDNPCAQRIAMANADPRHNALFGAAWTLGYVAGTTQAHLEALTPAALTGAFGLFNDGGAARPLLHVVRAPAELAGCERLGLTTSRPDEVHGFVAVTKRGARVVWLANLTPRPLTVELSPGGERSVRSLDAESWMESSEERPAPSRLSGRRVALAPDAIVGIEDQPWGPD
ncbi:MAG: hypothetical protein KGM15_00645 [Pseudomonadota bacterium]|nr:hypothetical protein [Pseudomonadota bacterium]